MFSMGSRRSAAALALLAVVTLAGCAQTVTGTATANAGDVAAVRAEQKQQRDCETARDDLSRSLTDAVRKAETDFVTGVNDVTTVFQSDAPRQLGASCGEKLITTAYSKIILDMQDLRVTAPSATILRSTVLRGLCATDGQIELTPQAEQACRAR